MMYELFTPDDVIRDTLALAVKAPIDAEVVLDREVVIVDGLTDMMRLDFESRLIMEAAKQESWCDPYGPQLRRPKSAAAKAASKRNAKAAHRSRMRNRK